jgi:integrase
MNTENLQQNYPKLIEYVENLGYSKRYVGRIKSAIKATLQHGKECDNYVVLYQHLLTSYGYEGRWARALGRVLGVVMRFDLDGEMPTRYIHHPFITYVAPANNLSPEFEFLVSNYRANAGKVLRHKKPRITSYYNLCVKFFQHLQERGIYRMAETNILDVVSFFFDGTNIIRGKAAKLAIRGILRCAPEHLKTQAEDLMDKLPSIPRKRSNYPFMTQEESRKLASTLVNEESKLRLLDKALTAVCYCYGMRGTDITSLTFDDVDFKNEIIHITQSKTGEHLDLPLCPLVGNLIYDYVMNERPKNSDSNTIFVQSNAPSIQLDKIYHHLKRVFIEAGVRVEEGQIGSRLLRHHVATYLLSRSISAPVISSVLGHTLPESLNHYIDADIEHLRELALDINKYPINTKILRPWKDLINQA